MSAKLDECGPVREGEALNTSALEAYLHRELPACAGPLCVRQFPQGFSNLTYLLTFPGRELVLRRPPFGNQVKTAHDMGREYRVLSKLCKVYPLAPVPFLYCEEESVIGAPFYVMERRWGVVIRKVAPPALLNDPQAVRRLSEAFIDNLAVLHTLDYKDAGLAGLGRPAGYVERQVNGWRKRYQHAQTDEIPQIDRAAEWLRANLPQERGAALIHNDYKYDNLLLDPHDVARIIAVFDWEMATLGDPLMDLGTTLAYWTERDDAATMQTDAFGPTMLPGSMTRRELVDRYTSKTGLDTTHMAYYYCFGLFKIAVIVQQIYARYVRGHTQDERFAQLDRKVRQLGAGAAQAAETGAF